MVASFKKFNKAMKENGNDYRLAVESLKMKDFIVKEKLQALDKDIAENAKAMKINEITFNNNKTEK